MELHAFNQTPGRLGIGSCDLPRLNLRFLESCDRGHTAKTKRKIDFLTCIRSSKSPIRGTPDGRKMLDDALIDQLNRGYVCPPDAGPAWRAACEYGFDMSLVEESLRL